MTDALKLHQDSIVIDAVCPLADHDPRYLDWYREGGVTTLAPTVGSVENARATLNSIAAWHRRLREREDLLFVASAGDVERAKRSGRLGIYLHLQGTDPIEDNLDLVDLYKRLGVGMIQLTYNVRNRVGDGCEERTDGGLSRFGMKLIERLNATRVMVDCTHTGLRTSLEAIEHSRAPVVLSHSNVASVQPSARNVSDELIEAVAASGGVVGVCGFPPMVANSKAPSLDELISHIDALVERAGIDHVGLGIDYYSGQVGVASDTQAQEIYAAALRSGTWGSAYPPPPHRYPEGIETPRTLPNLTARLLGRGYREIDVRKILGENWLRVMRAVWG
ncbi:MAG TPA: dipeptidase [Steroidobacteraceae bacterium]|nr:dipeptidase [Steroidobacteraceae bacterium]